MEFKQSSGALACVVFESCLSVLLQFGITSSGLKSSIISCLSSSALCLAGEYLSEQCISLVTRYTSQFSNKFEETEALIIAECLGSIVRRAGEQIEQDSAAWAPILCVSYIGGFHPDEEVAKAWMAAWNEALTYSGAGNKYSALVRTLPTVTTQICELLHSLSWVQRTIGLCVCRDVAGLFTFEIMHTFLYDLIVALLSCIKLRIWSGQAIVLETLVALLEKYRDVYVFERWGNEHVVEPPVSSLCDPRTVAESCEGEVAAEHTTHSYVSVNSIIRRRPPILHIEELAGAGEVTDEADSSSSITVVEVNCIALMDLILGESVRGEKTYKYSAAKALSGMNQSWRHLATHAPDITLRFLDIMIHQAGKV